MGVAARLAAGRSSAEEAGLLLERALLGIADIQGGSVIYLDTLVAPAQLSC